MPCSGNSHGLQRNEACAVVGVIRVVCVRCVFGECRAHSKEGREYRKKRKEGRLQYVSHRRLSVTERLLHSLEATMPLNKVSSFFSTGAYSATALHYNLTKGQFCRVEPHRFLLKERCSGRLNVLLVGCARRH